MSTKQISIYRKKKSISLQDILFSYDVKANYNSTLKLKMDEKHALLINM